MWWSLKTYFFQIVKSMSVKKMFEDISIFISWYILIYQQMANQSPLFKSLGDHAPYGMTGWAIWLAQPEYDWLQTEFFTIDLKKSGKKSKFQNFFPIHMKKSENKLNLKKKSDWHEEIGIIFFKFNNFSWLTWRNRKQMHYSLLVLIFTSFLEKLDV